MMSGLKNEDADNREVSCVVMFCHDASPHW